MIFHILARSEWDDAIRRGIYTPVTLRTEGIIHCSALEQIVETANLFYRGQNGLVLLRIDESKLTSPLRYERPAADDRRATAAFPHIHGPLNPDAVAQVVDFPHEADGSFLLPLALRPPGR